MAKREPWEQLDNESNEAFSHFQKYREMDIRRTCRKVAEITDIAIATIQSHSSKYRWIERAKEYDRHMDRLFIKTKDDAVIRMHRRQINTMLSAQELVVDQIKKHLKKAKDFPEPVIPIQHLAKLANIAHTDERVNMDVPDSIIRMETNDLDFENFTAEQLKQLLALMEVGKKKSEDD